MGMLDYESEIFSQTLDENVLVVLAKHLGVHRLVRQLIKLYSDPQALVLVINATQEERMALMEDLATDGDIKHMPRTITNEIDVKERTEVYLGGGALFVTSRILVVDMLTKRIPIDKIAGVLVVNAHRVNDTSTEAFIMRLYRQSNPDGFIKAFSDNVEAFTKGFAHAQRLMRNLYVNRLAIYPRFHASITHCFKQHSPETVELGIRLTDSCVEQYHHWYAPALRQQWPRSLQRMLAIQRAIIDIMDCCLHEVRRANPSLQIADLSLENGLFASFDFVVRQQLDSIWHTTGQKTKQLVNDLRLLNNLLTYLGQYDCVAFYDYLETIRTSTLSYNPSSWVFMDAATILFEKARERVYIKKSAVNQPGVAVGKSKRRKLQQDAFEKENPAVPLEEPVGGNSVDDPIVDKQIELVLEENPKWELLAEVLQEIEQDVSAEPIDPMSDAGRVLVLVNEERTAGQLREYLCSGGGPMLQRLFKKHLSRKKGLMAFNVNVLESAADSSGGGQESCDRRGVPATRHPASNRRGRRKPNQMESVDPSDPQAPLRAVTEPEAPSLDDFADAVAHEDKIAGEGDFFKHFNVLPQPTVAVMSIGSGEAPWRLERTLREVSPRYVVVYDPDLAAIRQLEIFKAERPGIPLRVYFLCYEASVEEQKYLTVIRKEKEAFERLIHEKSIMALPSANEPRVVPKSALDDISSRRAGRAKPQVQKVVVDMREFRSSLPSLLHARGIEIIPVTLEVGDYILCPEICVERKSVSDLISSLQSGRLYNQCEAMQRHYKIPVLLIEFDESKSFSLHSKNDFAGPINWNHLSSKITLLTLHFPTLRILWCRSPYATAEIFEALKSPFQQPDENVAAAIGADSSISNDSSYYNMYAQSLLLRMPGINSTNVKFLMARVDNLYELSTLSLERLKDLLGPHNGLKLYEFLHANGQQQRIESSADRPATPTS